MESAYDEARVKYTGLPDDLQEFLVNYRSEELLANPVEIVRSIIRMQAMLTGGMNQLLHTIDNDLELSGSSMQVLVTDENQDPAFGEGNNNSANNLLHQSLRQMKFKDNVLFGDADTKTTDPSLYFKIKHDDKLGEGGFAKVFKTTRRTDNKPCALKFCEP